jgi:hypothetical protein
VTDADRRRLLFGPYRAPRFKYGDVVFCEVRGEVVLSGLSAGPVPWPTTRGRRGPPFLAVFGALADAVRRGSALAVAHWWGISPRTVTVRRKALGVGAVTEGTSALRRERAAEPDIVAGLAKAQDKAGDPGRRAKVAAARRGKSRPRHVIEAMRAGRTGKPQAEETRRKIGEAVRRLGIRPPKAGRPWTAEEDELPGRCPPGRRRGGPGGPSRRSRTGAASLAGKRRPPTGRLRDRQFWRQGTKKHSWLPGCRPNVPVSQPIGRKAMRAAALVGDWRQCLRRELLPEVHGHQAKAPADLSFGIAPSGQCRSGHLALAVPGPARPASVQRRCERFLANDRIRPRLWLWHLARNLLAPRAGRRLRLLPDETPKANDLRVLKVSVAFGKRAVPVLAVCYRPGDPPLPLPVLIPWLLRRVRACLPADARVTLLADRGLAWPVILDACAEPGWHYLPRLQGQTRVILPDGREVTAAELAGRIGGRWSGEARLFKKAGWRAASVLACWPLGRPGPWLLVSDERACPRRFAAYGQRTWTEELFRDEKSQGLNWQKSRVDDPVRAERLLLLLALALILAIVLGVRVLKRGWRREPETGRRRGLSVVQPGPRWLRYAINHGSPLRVQVTTYLYPA